MRSIVARTSHGLTEGSAVASRREQCLGGTQPVNVQSPGRAVIDHEHIDLRPEGGAQRAKATSTTTDDDQIVIHGLDTSPAARDRRLTRRPAQASSSAARNSPTRAATPSASVIEHALHDRRTDDDAIGHLRDLNRLLGRTDTDADEYRLVGDVLRRPAISTADAARAERTPVIPSRPTP